ncbi:MAG: hypothetical protein N2258_03085 [Brevinematales bacterium]|nr:hypothetical protein [Brevinematales bacterium]
MNKLLTISVLSILYCSIYSSVDLNIFNSSYAYNGENASYWEETRYTLTYFENLFQPYFTIKSGENLIFKIGCGFLLPFNQEDKIKNYYPYFQTKVVNDGFSFIIGSLENDHNFPACILDPLVNMTPQVRVITKSQIPIDYENFPYGIYSHGFYEYGLQLKYKEYLDFYYNWQLPDNLFHRERFDIGLIINFNSIYFATHYWHNGGHENPHPVEITENYIVATGVRNTNFSILYLLSYFLPDRDAHPEKNIFGQALYLEWNLILFDFKLQPIFFITSSFINQSEKYISIEGDPFYRVPLYAGFNVEKSIKIGEECIINIGFVNGTFLPYTDVSWTPMMIRYDQKLQVNVEYKFSILE